MHARLLKETRDLLPILTWTVVLLILPYLILHDNGEGLAFLVCGFACLVLGGWSFGSEFQHRTLPLLLSQPIARSVLWRDKMLILAAAMGASLAVLFACMAAYCPVAYRGTQGGIALAALCAFCGAPYWTLIVRNAIAGMALAAVFPAAVSLLVALVAEYLFGAGENGMAFSAAISLILYSGLVYWLGYTKFKRVEAREAVSQELSLPPSVEAVFARPLAKLSARFRGPFATLLKKEFRLQQVSFMLTGVFVLIAVAGFCLLPRNQDLGSLVVGCDYMIFMVILPLVAGAISVGEEKGWELAEWHLSLPPSALRQWSAKMLATLSTSLVLGLLLPIAMALIGAALLGQTRLGAAVLPPAPEVLGWVLGSLLAASIAVYGASISHNTLRGILAAFFTIAAASALCVWLASGPVNPFVQSLILEHQVLARNFPVEHQVGPLIPLLISGGLFLMLCLVQGFAWSNFRCVRTSVRRIAAQFLVIFVALSLLAVAIPVTILVTISRH